VPMAQGASGISAPANSQPAPVSHSAIANPGAGPPSRPAAGGVS
jgi:hypothetical protein